MGRRAPPRRPAAHVARVVEADEKRDDRRDPGESVMFGV
jgi:hypothetical protein